MTVHATTRMAERKAEADRRAAAEAERKAQWEHSQRLGAERAAERQAAAERAEAIRREGLTPLEREIEDFAAAVLARHAEAAVKAATTPTTAKTDRTKPRHENMSVPSYTPPPADDPTNADALDSRARDLQAKAELEPTEGNRYQALIASREAALARSTARLLAERKAAELAVADAERSHSDPVVREREKARAAGLLAERIGQAEAACEAARLEYDRAIVETAAACKLAEHRIESRKAQMRADEAKAQSDIHALGNPYWKPPVSLPQWMFDALPPESQVQAVKDGVRVYDDPAPAFTRADAANVLRSRGSSKDRPVVSRAELAAMPPQEQAAAVRSAIIVD